MASQPDICVEVVYALPDRAVVRSLTLPLGSCVRDALQLSNVNEAAGIIAETLPLGIFSDPAALDTVLRDGDRVEIYRPLVIDPKTARRGRAKKTRR